MTHDQFLQQVQRAIIEGAAANPNCHGSEERFAERVVKHPEILRLRFRRIRRIVELLDAGGGVLLDAGAGIGLNAILAIACGVRQVWAVEFGSRSRNAELILGYLNRVGLSEFQARVHLVKADILELDLRRAQLDAVSSTEFLEHVSDPAQFHGNVFSWLKPGGRAYHRTGANGANPFKRRAFARHYEEIDRTVHATRRRSMIASCSSHVSGQELDLLVTATRGLVEPEIREAVKQWQASGKVKKPRTWRKRTPRDPISGVFCDHPLQPIQVLRELRSAGFVAKLLRPDFTNSFLQGKFRLRASRIAGSLISLGHPLSLPVAPWIEVLGVTPSVGPGSAAT